MWSSSAVAPVSSRIRQPRWHDTSPPEDGSSGAAWPPDAPAAYCESLGRLLKLPVRRVYPGHYGPFDGARMAVLIETQVADLGARQESER